MNNGILKKGIDLGKKISDTQVFEHYLQGVDSNFKDEVTKYIKPDSLVVYNLCVDACCNYKLFKVKGKKYIKITLTNHLDYAISEEDRVCMPYLENLDFPCKTITIDYDVFLKALEINKFTYSIDIDKDNFEMIDGGKLDYIDGQLNITKHHLQMPKRTAKEQSRRRLLLRKLYPDDKKWF